jgi:hypothetical protein
MIEISLITELFSGDRAPLLLPQIASYQYREGSAQTLQVSPQVAEWLDSHPGEVWQGLRLSV